MSKIADQYIEARGMGESMTKVSQTSVSEGRSENGTENLQCRNGFENENQTSPM